MSFYGVDNFIALNSETHLSLHAKLIGIHQNVSILRMKLIQ